MKNKILLTPIALVASMMMYGAHAEDVLLPEVRVRDTSTMISKRDLPATTETVTADQIADSINVVNTEDAIKYLPSLNIRKRFEGDRNGIVGSRTAGTLQSAKSVVYADGVLLSMLLGNRYDYGPRWFMVAPEEVEKMDVTYGPFSAMYPGNSAGAVVDIKTRMPKSFEAHTRVQAYNERFSLFGTQQNYTGNQQSATLGDRKDKLSWWVGFNRSETNGHPADFYLAPNGTTSSAGTPVTGAYSYRDHQGAQKYVLGAYAIDNSIQENIKAKFAYDLDNQTMLSYTFAVLRNDAGTSTQSYLKDVDGNAVYGGDVNFGGKKYTLDATLKPTKTEQEHLMHAVSLRQQTDGNFDWELVASLYDYSKDQQVSPSSNSTYGSSSSGSIARSNGTGWQTLDLRGIWRAGDYYGFHKILFGYHYDQYKLNSVSTSLTNWITGAGESANPASYSRGKTETQAIYVQDQWKFAPQWSLIPGIRYEQWQAYDGATYGSSNLSVFPSRKNDYYSPKLALSFNDADSSLTRLSLGRGYRMPTVAELYQGTAVNASVPVTFDPNLRPERDDSVELTHEKYFEKGLLRISLFEERAHDALWGSVTVTANTDCGSATSCIRNIDLIRTRGLELSGQGQNLFVHGLSIFGSVTYADSVILKNKVNPTSIGNYQPRIPLWRASALVAYSPDEHWTHSLGMRFSDKMTSSLTRAVYDEKAYKGVSQFFFVDIKSRYKFDKQWSASFGINNLNNYKAFVSHPLPQRTFMADLKYDIK